MNEEKNPALWETLWKEGIETVEDRFGDVITIDTLPPLGEPSPPCENDPAEDPEQQRSERAFG